MIRFGIPIVLTCAVVAAVWWGWTALDKLRGTVFWDFRLLLLLIGAFALLSIAEFLARWIKEKLGK